jgi:LPXTG-motif cell wall-anchored protein
MKGVDFMLILYVLILNSIAAAGLVTFMSENVVVLTIIGIALLLFVYVVFRFKKRKKKRHEVIHPVTEIIGNIPERIAELNQEIKPFGFAYEQYQDIFYSLMNPWQRSLGYCRLYDEACAAMSMIIDCEPIPFEYNGRRWLIEFWKGQYGMNTGGEVGIYYTTGPNLNIPGIFNGTFYFCVKDEDCINMSFAFRKKGNLLFTRSGYHWWLTGFKLGEYSKPSDLSMDIALELYDRRMATAFVNALKKAGYKENEYSVQGRVVKVRFNKPHTSQPLTRTAFTDFLMQRNNENLCSSYNYLTEAYTDTLDKLEIVRNESPSMYNQILSLGKPKAVYDSYSKIKGYLNN